jgi:flagellar M-ring protein FliF
VNKFSSFWAPLGAAQRAGLALGVVLLLAATVALGYWVLHDPYVPVASQLPAERLVTASKELDTHKIAHRVTDRGDTLEVRQSQVGRARLLLAGDSAALGGGVGLEIFGEADFSMTEFAQKVNYQRALQGELTRTIQAMDGVRSARVHVILSDGGVLKRNTGKASAAVAVSMKDGRAPSPSQVRGIQRLVAASVPEIQPDAVTVLDETGVSLSRRAVGGEENYSSDQLGMKREVDEYLQGKLQHMLQELAPSSRVVASVNALLDFQQLRSTTEQPIAVPKDDPAERATGVVVRERQTQRSAGGAKVGDGSNEDSGWEFDYKVGLRVEQSLQMPGAVRRLSVAVALHGAPASIDLHSVEQLVANAIGIDKQRGDTVAVLLLPAETAPLPATVPTASGAPLAVEHRKPSVAAVVAIGTCFALAALAGLFFALRRRGPATVETEENVDVEAMAARVRHWLGESA